jgi:hypothetical protein
MAVWLIRAGSQGQYQQLNNEVQKLNFPFW